MKQILILAAAVLLAVSCSQKKAPKVLVLYYSQTNTTKVVAEEIANALGADLEAILPVVPYEGDIPAVAARCAKDAAPELKLIPHHASKLVMCIAVKLLQLRKA